MPCPNCGTNITITLEVLLHGHIASCLTCEATLKVDRKQNAEALQNLQRVLSKINHIQGKSATAKS
jgi:hypothetical protein